MLTSPREIFALADTLKKREQAFVLATVTAVRGSASAKTGSKAIFSPEGKNLLGFVGGGCAESFVARTAREVLQARTPRTVTVDLDDEVFGLMPCGGVMDVYLEPHFPALTVRLPDAGAWNDSLRQFLNQLGYGYAQSAASVRVTNWHDAFQVVARGLAATVDAPLRHWREIKGADTSAPPTGLPPSDRLLIFGGSRITEEVERLAGLLAWKTHPAAAADFDSVEITAADRIVIASHHGSDAKIIGKALGAGCSYVALVASRKRSKLVLEDLRREGFSHQDLTRVFAPCGLALPSDTPALVAFSIACEILCLSAGAAGWS